MQSIASKEMLKNSETSNVRSLSEEEDELLRDLFGDVNFKVALADGEKLREELEKKYNKDYFKEQARKYFLNGFLRGFAKPSKISVSDWADKHRVLTTKYSSEPGPWRTNNAEYTREIMNVWTDDSIRKISVMAATQVGKTEIELNCIAASIAIDPSSIMVVYPDDSAVEKFSRRFDDMVEACEELSGKKGEEGKISKVSEKKSRDSANTKTVKEFEGGYITFVSAQSPNSLKSLPIRYLLMDEVDGYPKSSGREGDPIALAEARTTNFPNSKKIYVSAPILESQSKIKRLYEQGDKRKFYVPCPKCGHFQVLKFRRSPNDFGVKWDKDPEGNPILDSVYYECENKDCLYHWSDSERIVAITKGKWIAECECKGHASFWLSAMYSRFRSMADMVSQWYIANKEYKENGNSEMLQTFVNTVLAETWKEEGSKIETSGLLARREDYLVAPKEVAFITAGVDIQNDRIEVSFWGWGVDNQGWGLGHQIIGGDPTGQDVWNKLEEVLLRPIPHEACVNMFLSGAGIDTGNWSQNAAMFCQKNMHRHWYAIKGVGGGSHKMIWTKSPHHATKQSHVPLYTVGVDAVKKIIFQCLGMNKVGPAYLHFNTTYTVDYFNQLTVEEMKSVVKDNRTVQIFVNPKQKRNEALDTLVYAMAVREGLAIEGLNAGVRMKKLQQTYPKVYGFTETSYSVSSNERKITHFR